MILNCDHCNKEFDHAKRRWSYHLEKELVSSLAFLNHIRELPCLITGHPAEACHLRHIGMGGNKRKEHKEHFSAVPLRHDLHMEYHAVGPTKFEENHNINLWYYNALILREWLWSLENEIPPKDMRKEPHE